MSRWVVGETNILVLQFAVPRSANFKESYNEMYKESYNEMYNERYNERCNEIHEVRGVLCMLCCMESRRRSRWAATVFIT
jgi:hypothetical protein